MKKYFVLLSLSVFAVSCGSGNNNASSADSSSASSTATPVNDLSNNPDYQKGLELIGKNDCLTCHKIDEKLIGPSYQDVANKYAGNDTAVTYLAHKIIHGGGGAWGNVAMAAHDSLPEADAEALAKYVLLLKTK